MVKNRYKKLLLVCLVIIFALMSIETSILAEDILHTKYCDISNCPLCALIQISTCYSKNVVNAIISIIILSICIPLIYLISQIRNNVLKQTLVELKVIQIK